MLRLSYLLGCIAVIGILCGNARVVVSQSTGEPIPYASVGVVNRNLGTVTDSSGNFRLIVPQEYFDDTLRISSIGYEAKKFAIKDIEDVPDTIRLVENAVLLSEVVVKPQKIKSRTAGRTGFGGFICVSVEGDKAAGQGLAIPLTVKDRAWVKDLGFTIVDNQHTLSKMKFRVNFYRKDDGKYILCNIDPFYFDYNRKDLVEGKFKFIFPQEVSLDRGEYYVELEFLSNFVNEHFLMLTKPMTGRTRYRYASQSEWETLPFGASLYINYDSAE